MDKVCPGLEGKIGLSLTEDGCATCQGDPHDEVSSTHGMKRGMVSQRVGLNGFGQRSVWIVDKETIRREDRAR